MNSNGPSEKRGGRYSRWPAAVSFSVLLDLLETKKGAERIMITPKYARQPAEFPLYVAILLAVVLCALLALLVGAQTNEAVRASSQVVREETAAPSEASQTKSTQTQPKTVAATTSKAETEAVTPSASQNQPTSEETANTATHPASYVWTCGADYGGVAPADGSLSEWAPHYYVAHSYGPYGEVILGLEQGDTVTVNGVTVTVEGAVIMSQQCAYEDVMNRIGWDATVFQTCVPDSDDCRFVYARGASSTAAAADEARRWAGQEAGGAHEEMTHAPDEVLPEPVTPVGNPPTPQGGNPPTSQGPLPPDVPVRAHHQAGAGLDARFLVDAGDVRL